MTQETLQAELALSVYRKTIPDGMVVCWSGAVGNIQFDILRNDHYNMVYVVFAGTNEWADAWRHVWVRRETIADGVKVHRGWLADWQCCIPIIYAVLREQLEDTSTQICFLGHSYGGALAQIATWYYADHEVSGCRVRLITYGSPRAGNGNFALDLDNRVGLHYRFTINGDPIPHIPLALRYKHGGTHIQLPFRKSPHSMAGYLKSIRGE